MPYTPVGLVALFVVMELDLQLIGPTGGQVVKLSLAIGALPTQPQTGPIVAAMFPAAILYQELVSSVVPDGSVNTPTQRT